MIDKSVFNFFFNIGNKWFQLSYIKQCLFILIFYFIKNGVVTEQLNIEKAYLPASKALPAPVSYISSSLGNLTIAKLLQINTVNSWIVLHVLLLLMVFITIFIINSKNILLDKGLLLLIIFTLSSTSTLAGSIGKYDIFTFFGAVLLILVKSKKSAIFASFIMVLGNPEQALLASLCLFVISKNVEFEHLRSRAKNSIYLSAIGYLIIQIWMLSNSVESNRLTLIPYFLHLSIRLFLSQPLNSIWSWLGIGWLVVVLSIYFFRKDKRINLILALIIIPSIVSVFTADGARVYGMVVLPSFLALSVWFWSNMIKSEIMIKACVGFLIGAWISIPTLQNWGFFGQFLYKISDSFLIPLSDSVYQIGKNLFGG